MDSLKAWTVKYPGNAEAAAAAAGAAGEKLDERTWDDAIGSYSQALGEQAKRRKRIARLSGNQDPAFVFENDEDYPK
ncbi:unnamed protein product [Protopolystoma xenopodis]|uniref:Uncharacterized protein n=1 Tax=Protopolystoma xenopodis TaxID=117903 RepID=A0A448X1Q3_9PLAT|nr:unnamed protein product [Protopolystoma xenopodis]